MELPPLRNWYIIQVLEGYLDYQDWLEWTQETTKIYILSLGNYTFRVRAKDGVCYPNQGQIVTFANLSLNL